MLATKHINKVTLSNFVFFFLFFFLYTIRKKTLILSLVSINYKQELVISNGGGSKRLYLQALKILLICLVIFVVVVVVVCFACFIVVFCSFLFNCCKDLFLDIFYILTIISFKSEAIYKYTLERIGYCAVTKSYMLYIVNTFPLCCSPLQRSVRRSFVPVQKSP